MVAEVGFEPHDLRVMSPTSCQTAPLRDMVPEAGVEPVREKISRDFKSRASANSAIPAFATVFLPHCLTIIAPFFSLVNPFFVKKIKSLGANCNPHFIIFKNPSLYSKKSPILLGRGVVYLIERESEQVK